MTPGGGPRAAAGAAGSGQGESRAQGIGLRCDRAAADRVRPDRRPRSEHVRGQCCAAITL